MIDEFNRKGLGLKADILRLAERVTCSLEQIMGWRGKLPQCFSLYSGPEYISAALRIWPERYCTCLNYIQLGKPWHSGYLERYNCTVTCNWFGQYLSESIVDVQAFRFAGLSSYKNKYPNVALGGTTPKGSWPCWLYLYYWN